MNHRFAAILFLFVSIASWRDSFAQEYSFVVQGDDHLEFARTLCKEALKTSGVDAVFMLFPPATEQRVDAEMVNGNIHLAFVPPDKQRLQLEKDGALSVIRIPLERGLLGYRTCLVTEKNKDILRHVSNVEQLRKLTIGQGVGWGDIEIYKHSGFRVVEAPFGNIIHPLKALAANHFDLLPLGISEYGAFLDEYKKQGTGIVADEHILIRYPWDRYVYISKNAPNGEYLLQSLEKGFEKMVADGSFQRIYEHHRGKLKNSLYEGKRIIDLPNPYSSFEDVDPRFKDLIIPIQ